ncbi:MAG: tetratricopeptide repeat protein [Planctomycetes bacterium]|nr:tetratricopeptide repeat protein [Planctomycetota bacterium]
MSLPLPSLRGTRWAGAGAWPRVAPAALALTGLALFGSAAGHGFTSWDDDLYVTRNPAIRDLSIDGVFRLFAAPSICNYHPLTLLSFTLEHAAVGFDPWLYHVDNVLLHLAAALLAFELARRWLGSGAGAVLAAALFLAHPLRVESVAWVAERKGLLAAVFCLASLLAYTAHLDAAPGGRRGRLYAVSLALFLLALLSKVSAVSLPAALLVLLVARQGLTGRAALGLAPFAALAALFAAIGYLAQAADGAVKGLHGGSLGSHLLTPFAALAFYAEKLVVPVVLSPRYVLAPAAGPGDPRVLVGLGIAAVLALAAWGSLRRERKAFLGIGLFAAAWAPVSGIAPSSTIAADRYLYLPAFGLFLALGAALGGAAPGGRRWIDPLRRAGFAAACLFLGWCAVLTPSRVEAWRDGEALWTDALRQDARNPFARNQLSVEMLARGRYAEAAAEAAEAGRLGLREPRHLFNLALAHRGLGDPEWELETARAILRIDPGFVPAWLVVARRLREDGDLDGCERELDRLLAERPDDAGLLLERGRLEEARGRTEQALALHLAALERRRDDAEAILGAGVLLARLGDRPRALRCLERALDLEGGVLPPGAVERLAELRAVLAGR